jgi:flagellar motility protein MotE (MotC chaperone)
LLFVFLLLKGWVLVSLVREEDGGTCLAEPVSADIAQVQPTPRVYDTDCELRVGGLIQRIKEEEERLEQKAMGLEEKERRLQIFSRELLETINNLKKLRLEVHNIHQQIEAHENEREERLIKIYDAMEPDNAAQRLEAMDDSLGSWLLLRINVRKAGQILGAMSPAKAGRITANLRGEDPHSAKEIEKALQSSRAKTGSKKEAARAPQAKPREVAQSGPQDTANERLLQIATFSEPQRAESVVQALNQKGYRSFQKEWLHGEPRKAYYKVFVGPFPNKTKASETKAKLEKQEGYRGIMIRTNAAAGA